jgi:uncharacterized protein YndB with AHSA1/START domain
MSTQAIAVERKLTRYFRNPDCEFRDSFSIARQVHIQTDANRLFQALTKPEYLETWLTLPGDNAESYVVAWHQHDSFRFDHYHGGRRDLIIRGDYRLCRRRKLLFTWRTIGDLTVPESLVYLGLHGNFTNTILELHHRGISSAPEHLWQQEMWDLSLDRLTRLFQR